MDFDDAVSRARQGEDADELARVLLNKLAVSERLGLLDGDVPFWSGVKTFIRDGYNKVPIPAGAVKRLKIPGLLFADGPRGIVMGSSTCFPVSMARGATWDIELEERIGAAIGMEGRAQGANFFGGVCVNLPRHPAWGRSQETYGEDSILLGEFGAALSRGVQKNMMAIVKHYALNSMENSRFKVDVACDEAALHEVYLPHFRRTIDAGKAMAVMSAYNSVNGEWAGQNKVLLTDILRDQWGFDGVVCSDFLFGLRDPILSLEAGLDVEEPFIQQRAKVLPNALKNGQISQALVDRSALRILATQIKHYKQRDPEEPDRSVVFCPAHQQLAKEAAARSIVLLKNNAMPGSTEPLLPLKVQEGCTYAVIGRLAAKNNTGDHGSSDVRSPKVISPYEGIRAAVEERGGRVVLEPTDDVAAAVEVARQSDVSILIVGNDASDEGEHITGGVKSVIPWPSFKDVVTNLLPLSWHLLRRWMANKGVEKDQIPGFGGDRARLGLRPQEIATIEAVSKVNARTIVVIISGSTVIVEPWISRAEAVLYGWYGGCQGGAALADVLIGVSNVSGRLPFTLPKSEADLPEFTRDTDKFTYDRWFGQRYLDRSKVTAHFPLGFGLSYTTFSLSDALISDRRSCGPDEHFEITVRVSNTGIRAGHHVVQIYGTPSEPQVDFPTRVLLGFMSVEVKASQQKLVKIPAYTQPLKRWQGDRFAPVSEDNVIEISSHAGDLDSLRLNCKL